MVQCYRVKLVLHIPHYAWENDQLVKIDYTYFKEYLYKQFEEIGLIVIDVFRRTYFELRAVMRQEAFAYECSGVLYVVAL